MGDYTGPKHPSVETPGAITKAAYHDVLSQHSTLLPVTEMCPQNAAPRLATATSRQSAAPGAHRC